MKKIISLILALSGALSMCWQAAAETAAAPTDGMVFWVDAGAESSVTTKKQGKSYKLEKWLDISGTGKELLPGSSLPTYFPDAAKSDLKDNRPAVHFAKNQYLTASDVDYSGDASFVIYYRNLSYNENATVFSSAGSGSAEEGKTPFSIVVNANKGLSFKMGENTYDMNISFDSTPDTTGDEYENYLALYLTIDSKTKTVNVYKSLATEQESLAAAVATFETEEIPYWKNYSYNGSGTGIVGDLAESIIYNRVLSFKELSTVNQYLKVKYENPVLSRLALESEIYEIKKGSTAEPKIIGVGVLMGQESRMDISNAKITSANEDVILVINNKTLKAIGFGSSKITISYEGLPDYSFVVNVPQTVINEPVLTEAGGVIKVEEKIENYKEEQALSIVMAAALYEGDELLDIEFENASIGLEHTFTAYLKKPASPENCKIYIMLLDGDTLVPVTDAIIK